ncbi:hypothetical protein [Myxococcus faecalis]
MDGSPAARTRYARALVAYWLAEADGRAELGVEVEPECVGGEGLVV